MSTDFEEKVCATLRLLSMAQRDSLVWLRDLSSALQSVLQIARAEGQLQDISPLLGEALDGLDEALNQAQMHDVPLAVIQAEVDKWVSSKA